MILERYYNRDVVHTFINLTLFILAIILSNLLIRFFNDAYSNGFGVDIVFKYIVLLIPENFLTLLPVTTSLAITLCFGKYFSNNEMFVTLAGGVTWAQVTRNVLKPIIFISFMALIISMYVTPFTVRTIEMLNSVMQAQTVIQSVSDQKIIKIPNGTTAYIGKKNGDFLSDVFLYQTGTPKYTVITAPTGHISTESNSSSIILKNASFYSVNPITKESSYGTAVTAEDIMHRKSSGYTPNKNNTLYPNELISKIINGNHGALVALCTRIGSFFTVLVSGLLALSMCRLRPRQNKYAKLLPSAAVLAIYLSISMFINTIMESDTLPVWIGAWICHVTFGSIAIYNLRKQNGSEKNKKIKRK